MTTPLIFNFFKKVSKDNLPVPTSPLAETVNKHVERELQSLTPGSSGKKRKRAYGDYPAEIRAKIARYAIENGNTAAAKHFSKVLGNPLNESTVRGMKTSYEKLKTRQGLFKDKIVAVPRSPRGKPLKMGDYDSKVCEYIRNLRAAGGVVNSRIVLAAAKGVLLSENRTLLAEYGGNISLDKPWAVSILRRLNMVKRKGTKGVKTLPDDFENIKTGFLKRIGDVVTKYHIPDNLIINWDQTGSNFVPIHDWTMEVEGSKQVAISHLDDKRQMTVLLGCTKSGEMIPPQLIYQGKTDACHPTYKFPEAWDIAHTESHWSTSESMIRYVTNVIVPYVERTIDENDLPLRQRALCVFDIYKAHRGEDLLNLLKKHNIHVVFIPASCTDRLQPLDLGINGPFKQTMKSLFEDYYAGAVAEQLKTKAVHELDINPKLSTIKPLHAKWLSKAVNDLEINTPLVQNAWKMAGLQ